MIALARAVAAVQRSGRNFDFGVASDLALERLGPRYRLVEPVLLIVKLLDQAIHPYDSEPRAKKPLRIGQFDRHQYPLVLAAFL